MTKIYLCQLLHINFCISEINLLSFFLRKKSEFLLKGKQSWFLKELFMRRRRIEYASYAEVEKSH